MSAFRGRTDVFAVANLNDGPKPTYRPVKGNLTENVVHHLAGKATFGIYPLLPNHTTWFLAIDCDGEGAQRECELFSDTLGLFEIPSYLERSRSGQGMHCWIFFDQPVPAFKARLLGKNILARAHITKSFDRFFPSQDFHTGKGMGNLIALPFQGESQKAKNTVFLDPVSLEPYECQWTVLEKLQRVSLENLEQAIIESQEDPSFVPLPLARKVRVKTPVPTGETGIETSRVVLGEHVEVVGPYPPVVLDYLNASSCFANPEWYRRQRNGDHLTNTPRFIRVGGPLGDRWILPRGIWPQLHTLLKRAVRKVELEDNRIGPTSPLVSPSWERTIELKNYQSILDEFQQGKVRVLIATRKRLGEGWDCPPLSTLILAMPISGRGSDLKQMIGRLTRIDPDKESPQFIDYLDAQVPQFQSMFRGRVKVYQKTLRDDKLPADLRLEKPQRKGKATLDYGPGPPKKGASKARERPVSGPEQLSLF